MKQRNIILILLLSVTMLSCNSEKKDLTKENTPSTYLTLTSEDSISLKLTKIYDIGTLNIQDSDVRLEKNKDATFTEKLDKLILCYALADNGFSTFYLGPDKERKITIKKDKEGSLKFVFDNNDHINKFTQTFHEKLNSLSNFEGEANKFLLVVDNIEHESLNQLNEIKSKIDNSAYQTLKSMISGKMAHFKFMGSERYKSLTPQSSYYDFTDNLDFNNDHYLTYSDNINTVYSTLKIQYARKYNNSFEEASDKLEFINEYIKNNEVRSQLISILLSQELPEKTAQEKQAILEKLKSFKITDTYYQYITSIEAGTALGAKIGTEAKYLETLISENKNSNLKSLKGKTVYVDNWATWCGPCVKSMKSFITKYDELKKVEDVIFVFVSFDRKESIWRNFLTEMDFPEENIIHLFNGPDLKSEYAKYYNIQGFPKYFVVDKSGMISNLDPSSPSDDDFEQFLKTLSE